MLAHTRRQHRWVRGDWQLLWWLFPVVPARGRLERNRLPLISRWKTLRQPAPQPGRPGDPGVAAARLDDAARLGRGLDRGRPGRAGDSAPAAQRRGRGLVAAWPVAPRRVARRIGATSRPTWRASRLQVVFLANTTYSMLHAIALTLVRLVFTRRRLLEWETAAATAARVFGPDARTFVSAMSASPALALGSLVAVVGHPSGRRGRSPCPSPSCGRWPRSSAWCSAVRWRRPRHELSAADRRYLESVALETWRYFDRHVTAEHQALPPDNIQLVPELRVARADLADQHRHEPAGRRGGARPRAHRSRRAGRAHRGHAGHGRAPRARSRDTCSTGTTRSTLTPLVPAYISTVDSGNLAGALMCLATAMREFRDAVPAPDAALAARLTALATRADRAGRRDGLQLPVRSTASAVRHRLSAAGRRRPGPPRHVLLRPAGVGSAAGQLRRHRQGRRCRRATGSTSAVR